VEKVLPRGMIMAAIDIADSLATLTVNDVINQVRQELKINFP